MISIECALFCSDLLFQASKSPETKQSMNFTCIRSDTNSGISYIDDLFIMTPLSVKNSVPYIPTGCCYYYTLLDTTTTTATYITSLHNQLSFIQRLTLICINSEKKIFNHGPSHAQQLLAHSTITHSISLDRTNFCQSEMAESRAPDIFLEQSSVLDMPSPTYLKLQGFISSPKLSQRSTTSIYKQHTHTHTRTPHPPPTYLGDWKPACMAVKVWEYNWKVLVLFIIGLSDKENKNTEKLGIKKGLGERLLGRST